MIRTVLVALDSSSRAPSVFEIAVALARSFHAKLHVLHVITIPQEFPPAAHVEAGDPLPQLMEAAARAELQPYLDRGADVAYSTPVIRAGHAAREILKAAEDLDVDVIVIGSHGYRGFDRILGTTAARVVNVSRRHVFVVHDRTRA
jgi:nucleotide-binding universal stress UspA family protein